MAAASRSVLLSAQTTCTATTGLQLGYVLHRLPRPLHRGRALPVLRKRCAQERRSYPRVHGQAVCRSVPSPAAGLGGSCVGDQALAARQQEAQRKRRPGCIPQYHARAGHKLSSLWLASSVMATRQVPRLQALAGWNRAVVFWRIGRMLIAEGAAAVACIKACHAPPWDLLWRAAAQQRHCRRSPYSSCWARRSAWRRCCPRRTSPLE